MPYRKQSRNTPQRRVILEELRQVTSHPTAAELYELVRTRMPKVSLGTVYRNLDFLARRGTIQKLTLGRSEARFDGNPDHHYHVRCVGCGRVDDVNGVSADFSPEDLDRVHDYQILGHRLEFVGVCGRCRRMQEEDAGIAADPVFRLSQSGQNGKVTEDCGDGKFANDDQAGYELNGPQ